MKTIIISNGTDVTFEIKTDIIATMTELQTEGFNTRFTNMAFSNYGDSAKKLIDLRTIEEGWQSLIAAVASKELQMTLLDVSANAGPVEIVGIPIHVTGISITPATVTLAAAATQQITVTIAPVDATNQNVTYTTSDATKATVSSTGLITAVATGSATITATTEDGSFTDTVVVTVS